MDFKNLIHKLFVDTKGKNIPAIVLKSFQNQFDNPLNTEWSKSKEHYEAIFYKDEKEQIARFNLEGKLESLKTNLPLESVPEQIKKKAAEIGELMNAIAIHKENKVTYELIIRDQTLVRYFLYLNANGEVIEKEKL